MIRRIQNLAWHLRRSRAFTWGYLCQLVLLNALIFVAVPSAFADDCARDPTRAEDCLRTPGFAQNLGTGVAVIGTVLVNGMAIQTIILQQRDPQAKDDKDEPPVQFFLDVKTEGARTILKPDGKDTLWVYATVTCSDPKVDCSGMTSGISITPGGANATWLQAQQSGFSGPYKALQFSAANPNPAVPVLTPSASIDISAQVQGGTLSAVVPLQLPVEYELRAYVDGKQEAAAHFDRTRKEWVFPEIVVYFAAPGEETPVKPSFQYGFPQPPFETDPPDLCILEETTSPDDCLSYCFHLKLKDPQDLAQQFGPNLDQKGGRIQVKITAIDDQQKSYSATVAYSLSPELVLLTWAFEEDSRVRADKHSYKEVEFGEYEFVCDAQDELNIAAIFVRSDLLEDGRDPAEYLEDAVECVRISSAQLAGSGSEKFDFTLPDASQASSLFEFKLKAKQGMLATSANSDVKLALDLKGQVSGDAARLYAAKEISARLNLAPQLVYLKLLVVPGEYQGTSVAVAYVGTSPGNPQPLRQVPLVLDSKAQGSGPTLVPREPQQVTNQAGVARWLLDYHGMSWKSLAEARFRVRCGLTAPDGDPAEATYCDIDVNANGAAFVEALTQSAGHRELSNPHWQSNSKVLDYLWPDSLTGPLNNVCALASGSESYGHYTCGQLRDRIWGFAIERRFSHDLDLAASMNGFDFGKYEIAPIHVYFGLFPAGNEDPYFIDPWWDQAFNPDKVVLTYASEVTKLGASVALLLSTGAAILVALGQVATLAAAGALITNWLTYGVAAGTYATLEVTYRYLGYGFHIGKTPIEGEPWIAADGCYKETPSKWGEAYFRDPHLKTGTVQPLEPW